MGGACFEVPPPPTPLPSLGLSDVARSDFRVMKDLAAYTHVPPAQREVTFHKFLGSLTSNPAAMKELTSWGLQLDRATVSLSGRLLPTEKITFGGKDRTVQVRQRHVQRSDAVAVITPCPSPYLPLPLYSLV